MVMRSANSNQNNSNSSSAQVGGRASPPPSAAKPNANNATSVVNMNPPRTPLTPSNQKHIAAQPHSHSHSNAPTTPPTAKQQAGAPRTPPLSTEKQLAAAESKEHAMRHRLLGLGTRVGPRQFGWRFGLWYGYPGKVRRPNRCQLGLGTREEHLRDQ